MVPVRSSLLIVTFYSFVKIQNILDVITEFDFLSKNIVASNVLFTLLSCYLSFIFSFISVNIPVPI